VQIAIENITHPIIKLFTRLHLEMVFYSSYFALSLDFVHSKLMPVRIEHSCKLDESLLKNIHKSTYIVLLLK